MVSPKEILKINAKFNKFDRESPLDWTELQQNICPN